MGRHAWVGVWLILASAGCRAGIASSLDLDAGSDVMDGSDARLPPAYPADSGAVDGGLPADEVVPVFRYRSTADHLWTTDVRGEGAVAAGYVWEGTAFYLFGAAPRAPSKAIIRARGAAGHVYVTSEVELSGLLASGYVQEGVLGYAAVAERPDLTPLFTARFSTGLRLLSTSSTEISAAVAAGYQSEGIFGYVPKTGPRPKNNPYTVGVYYFGMWSAKAFDSIQGWPFGNPGFYGAARSNDWWLGVRDFYERNCAVPGTASPNFNAFCNDDWSYLKPVIGFYDLGQVSTVERHIAQAKQNGIGFFSFYWFWNTFTNREDLNDGLESFLRARNGEEMKFVISICEHGGHLSISAGQTAAVARLIATKYTSRPNYLRTRSGQPIIHICDTKGIWNFTQPSQPGVPPDAPDMATIDLFLNALRTEVHGVTGQYPVLSVRADDARYDQLIWRVEAANCILPTGPNPSYASVANGAGSVLTSFTRPTKSLFPCFMENLDDRPRIGVITSPTGVFSRLTDHNPENFARGLSVVKSWMDARLNDEAAQILTLYAWNEWHEGGRLEPNVRDGALYLNLVSDIFQLPIGDDPCRKTGNCPAPP